ncbi:MAG: MarR family transcriptional regulator [Lachnospiraceae bacterium]|nr:MarR family transcriptional regulator [Lachnospiraceae bacterium]MDD3797069.1 MarR family transcriptional regulator [Lachnospiraceae bacterium]
MDAKKTINDTLVVLINEIWDLEKKAIITPEFADITSNDIHIIEAIGPDEGRKMTDIAKRLNITVGALTTSMNSLVKKDYVIRERSEEDRRIVNIRLLDKGLAAYAHHADFHQKMTESIVNSLSEEELAVWNKSLHAVTDFFRNYGK